MWRTHGTEQLQHHSHASASTSAMAMASMHAALLDSAASSAVNASRLPDNVLECIFAYLPLRDLRSCARVCRNWRRYLDDENNDVWRALCLRRLADEALRTELLSAVPTFKAKLRAFHHAWNPNDCSPNVYVKPNGFTLHR